jgi:tetrapyrrole methylase family protein/MazG family protein
MAARYPSIPISEFRDFVRIIRRLRRDCPWDRRQTHRSLRESLIEETYEVIESLDRNRISDLRGELGDILLHIVLHSTIAEQNGEFTLRQVLQDINQKLIRRHPHVFGRVKVRGTDDVKRNWEQIKLAEGRASYLEGVPRHLPALQRALRLQQRAARVGFDWESPEDVWQKVREEVEEVRKTLRAADSRAREEEFGDLLFALVNYARFLRVNPETALRRSTEKFTSRFRFIEQQLRRRGKDPRESTLAEMDELWNVAKKRKSRHRRRLRSPVPRRPGK